MTPDERFEKWCHENRLWFVHHCEDWKQAARASWDEQQKEIDRLEAKLREAQEDAEKWRKDAYQSEKRAAEIATATAATARREALEEAAKICPDVASDVSITTDHGYVAIRTGDKIQAAIRALIEKEKP